MSERNRRALQQIGEGAGHHPGYRSQGRSLAGAACCRHLSRPEKRDMEALHAFAWQRSCRRVLWLESDTRVCRPLDYL